MSRIPVNNDVKNPEQSFPLFFFNNGHRHSCRFFRILGALLHQVIRLKGFLPFFRSQITARPFFTVRGLKFSFKIAH